MYLTVKQQVKHLTKEEYQILRELCHIAKNLFNQALYNVRQFYFDNGKYLNYYDNYSPLKSSVNYKSLNSNMAQQILKEVDGAFRSFFALLKREGYDKKKCNIPYYLPKDGFTTLVIGFVRLKGNKLVLPYSNAFKKEHKPIEITIPPMLVGKKIKEIRIIPKARARFFEIQYTYEAECIERNLNKNNALALDLGINNLVTGVTSMGKSFIIDGKGLKSINQGYNRENCKLQSIKDKQKLGNRTTKRQQNITKNRNNRANDYISKAASKAINYCIENDIGKLVVGYSKEFQKDVNMGTANNQKFVNIPYGKLRNKLKYLCELNGIEYIEQEESYTSKASFWDGDTIPVYNENDNSEYKFSGKRVKRGLYQTANGKTFNADINGALNILKKSNVVSLEALYSRGDVDTPWRIRIA